MISARRGEVWIADLGLAAKVRPVLVFNTAFTETERALFAIIPHTTAVRGGRFEVNIGTPWLAQGAFDVQGLRQVPGSVFFQRLGVLDPQQLEEIARAVRVWLEV